MKQPEYKDSYDHMERRFLNEKTFHSTGNIVAKLALENEWISSWLYISNCDRTISLDIDSETVEGLDNSLFKLTQIIEVCENFKKALDNLRPYIEEKKQYEKWKEEQYKNKKDE